jgi:membrane protease YdiL (CAAX protease family)
MLIAFFVLAFAWTWAWQAPLVLGYQGSLWLVFLAAGAVGPSMAAIVVTRGRVLRVLRPRGRWWWYVIALLIPITIAVAALAVNLGLGYPAPAPLLMAPALGAMLLPPLGEELGWRGYAYPRLADTLGPATAAVLSGTVWGLWHLPTALMPGASLAQFPLFMLLVTAGGIWMAWLYEASGRCVMVAVAAHAAINAGIVARGEGPGLFVVSLAAGAVALLTLARGRAVESAADVPAPAAQ